MSIYDEIFNICLKHKINFYSTLPCSYNIDIITQIEKQSKDNRKKNGSSLIHIPLVREESGVALSAGAYLGGKKPAMIFQNQGLGNMITQLIALNGQGNGSYGFPNLYIISNRGSEGEKIAAQKPLGQKTEDILALAGIKSVPIASHSDLDNFEGLLQKYEEGQTVAILVKPEFENPPTRLTPKGRVSKAFKEIQIPKFSVKTQMTRYNAISLLINHIRNEYIISNIGHPSRELYDIKDRERNFYLTSSLGQAYMVGLGFALSRGVNGEKVICFEGDGGILMNASSLTLVANTKPQNLILTIFDNGVYGSTGNIETYTSSNINLSALAQSCGFPASKIRTISNEEQLSKELNYALHNEGPFLLHILVTDELSNKNLPIIPYSVKEIKERFMNSFT